MRLNAYFDRPVKPSVLLYLLGLIVAVISLSGCNRSTSTHEVDSATQNKFILRYQDYPGRVSLPELAEDLGFFRNIKLDYKGSIQGGPENMQAMMSGDVDYSSAFNGAIVKLAATTRKSPNSIVAVVGANGSDKETYLSYEVLEDSPIRTAHDLKGKKIAGNTLGAQVEFILKEWLSQNGLSEKDVKQVELIALPPVATEQALRQGQIQAAAMYDLMRIKADERGGLRQLFSDIDLYGEYTSANYVFTRRFTQQHPKIVQDFVNGVALAQQWSQAQPKEIVRERMIAIIAKRKRNENDNYVKHWRSYGIAEKGAFIQPSQYQPWIDFMVKRNELKADEIKPEEIFSNEFNSFAQNTLSTTVVAKEGVKK